MSLSLLLLLRQLINRPIDFIQLHCDHSHGLEDRLRVIGQVRELVRQPIDLVVNALPHLNVSSRSQLILLLLTATVRFMSKSFIENPFVFLQSLWVDPRHLEDEEYKRHKAKADAFEQDELSEETATLLLEQSRLKVVETVAGFERLDDKRDSFIKFSSGMLVFLAAASRAFSFELNFPLKLSAFCFLIAAIVLLLSRRTVPVPATSTIQSFREGIGKVPQPNDWVSAALHKTCEGLKVHGNIVGHHLNFALFWLIVGLVCLVITVFSLKPPSATTSSLQAKSHAVGCPDPAAAVAVAEDCCCHVANHRLT